MLTNKKILIVAPYGFNDRMANFIEFISARLLAKNSWQVIGLTRYEDESNAPQYLCGIKIYRYKSLRQGILFLLKILFIGRPAIVHIHNQRNNRLGTLTAILTKLSAKPLLFTEYGLLHDHYLTADRDDPLGKPLLTNGLIFSLKQIIIKSFIHKTAPWRTNIKNYLFHWPLTHANKIIFVSRHNLPLAKELGLKNYLYLPYILDDARWSDKKTETKIGQNSLDAREKINQLANVPFCLFIGQLKLRKGWDVYLKAVPFIEKSVMPFFVVVSASAVKPPEYFSQLVDQLSIADRIIFLGKVDGQTLKKVYDLSKIIVVPSRYEGFGLIATEAFDNKKPLIASAVLALTETVIDDYNGLLVPPGDPKKLAQAICRLAHDQTLAKKLIAGGQATLERLKSDELKNQWLNFYDKIIS